MTNQSNQNEFPSVSTLEPSFEAVMDYVASNYAEEISLDDLASAAGISKFTLCRRFERSFGITAMHWLWRFRTWLAREVISSHPAARLTDVAFTCGFTSSAHFSRSFQKEFGSSPSRLRSASSVCGLPSSNLFMTTALDPGSSWVRRVARAALRSQIGAPVRAALAQ